VRLLNLSPVSRVNEWKWHPWFAWRPVETRSSEWVWAESIYRRRVQAKIPGVASYFEYERHQSKHMDVVFHAAREAEGEE